MKLPEGVEWGLHCAAHIAQCDELGPVTRRQLAEQFGLPEAYLAKHLQAMVRAGLLIATPGPRGGFRLARKVEEITALDIIEAIDGAASPFVCQEIRQRGLGAADPAECRRPCAVSAIMAGAHQAWRNQLKKVSLAQIVRSIPPAVRVRAAARAVSSATD
jgi:Rrf2 family protein